MFFIGSPCGSFVGIARGKPSKGDFVGWTGIGPIAFFIEYAIGIRADAPANGLVWNIRSSHRVGIDNFSFGGKTLSLACEEADATGRRHIKIRSSGVFDLTISWQGKATTIQVPANKPAQLRL